jgi:hypothetical protein
MLEAGLRSTFRHFWTFFFIAAAITVPLHLIYVFLFHNVIAIRELAPQIALFPSARQVHFVGPPQLQHARMALWVLDAVEVALLPLAIRAAGAVLEMDQKSEVPTALKAWRDSFRRHRMKFLPRSNSAFLIAVLIAVVVGVFLDAIARLIAEPIGTNWSFVVLGLAQGSARAASAAFFLGTAAASSRVTSTRDVVKGGVL